ncbi:hypothetical protein [Caulobacter phage Cr30]|uniref:hypothetical protein n=1 Tax=Caulobacter phage Cr30 TaxID=1357714 RepID=UPI0004A9B62F|nr:hypothetical protein OZ74_gp200 [Caulobacter phage Cr30]AGS81143.1 hypothetical protein [Caulobacter phage Cr30]
MRNETSTLLLYMLRRLNSDEYMKETRYHGGYYSYVTPKLYLLPWAKAACTIHNRMQWIKGRGNQPNPWIIVKVTLNVSENEIERLP